MLKYRARVITILPVFPWRVTFSTLRLYRKTRQKSNCWKRTIPYLDGCTLLVTPVTETKLSFCVWNSTLATIPFRPRTTAIRKKSRLAEAPATSNLTGIDTSSRFFYTFIWNGKDKVKRCGLISNIEKGGLKMLDIESMISARRVICLNKFWGLPQYLEIVFK